ncbi:MAG TPA: MFS transporter [Candidatus Sulfotelmatobacter sp.]|nr:MFS transporter [Candidatus Sulfotelmatobacter sp.]
MLIAAVIGSGMSFIDQTAVNVALPIMQRDLHADARSLQWVIEGYTLFLASLILLGGALGDRYGRRLMFMIGLAIFALASLGCALAGSIVVVNAARAVQGVGAALAVPESLALISANFSGAARGRAIGTWSGFASATGAIGPVLGGWLAEHWSWRGVFLINLPLAALAIAICWLRVPESRDPDAPLRPDVVGPLLATGGLGALTFGLVQAQSGPIDARLLGLFALALVLAIAFVVVEHRTRAPMIPLDLFRSRAFSGANIYTLFLYMALGGSLYFVPYLLINVQHYTPVDAGAALLPFVLLNALLSRWAGGLMGRIGARVPLVVGAALVACGMLAYARPGVGATNYWTTYFWAAVVLGLGTACFVAPLTTTVFDCSPPQDSGVASGFNNAVARSAMLFAIAVFGIVLVRVAPGAARLGAGDPSAYLHGFRAVMLASVALCALAAVLAVVLIPGRPQRHIEPGHG